MKNSKTKVLFLIEKDGEDVFAYFPEEVSNNGRLRSCYAHIGQYSVCHPTYAKECKEATPEQYADLESELSGWGYELAIQNALAQGLERHPEFIPLVDKIVELVANKINVQARRVESDMDYSGKFVLEEVIKKLQALV